MANAYGQKITATSDPLTWSRDLICYKCHHPGHISRHCPNRRSEPHPSSSTLNPAAQPPPAAVCPLPPATYSNQPVIASRSLSGDAGGNYIHAVVDGVEQLCLMDTGCERTVFPRKAIITGVIQPTSQRMTTANGTNLELLGETEVWCEFGDLRLKVHGLVSESVPEVLFGADFLNVHATSWDFVGRTLIMYQRVFPMQVQPSQNGYRCGILHVETDVPERSECNIRDSPRSCESPVNLSRSPEVPEVVVHEGHMVKHQEGNAKSRVSLISDTSNLDCSVAIEQTNLTPRPMVETIVVMETNETERPTVSPSDQSRGKPPRGKRLLRPMVETIVVMETNETGRPTVSPSDQSRGCPPRGKHLSRPTVEAVVVQDHNGTRVPTVSPSSSSPRVPRRKVRNRRRRGRPCH